LGSVPRRRSRLRVENEPAIRLYEKGPALQATRPSARRGPLSAVNYPSDGQVAAALRAAGACVTRRHYETAKRLD